MRTITVLFVSVALFVGCGIGESKASSKLDKNGLKLAALGLQYDLSTAMLGGGEASFTKKQAFEMSGIQDVVSSTQLATEYDDNEVSADEKYKNKLILIKGKVESISKDFMGYPYLALDGLNMFQMVKATFDKANTSQLSNIKKGQNVQIVCQVDSYIIGSVLLEACQSLDSYLTSNINLTSKMKSLASDIILGKQSIGKMNDEVIRLFYVMGKNFPADSTCQADDAFSSKACLVELGKMPKEERGKLKAEVDALTLKSAKNPGWK